VNGVPVADADGDGQYDSILQYYTPGQYGSVDVAFGAGFGWREDTVLGGGVGSIWNPGPYAASLYSQTHMIAEDVIPGYDIAQGKIKFVDLNADGLTDVVVNHTIGGRLLANTGVTWQDFDSYASYSDSESTDPTAGHWVPTAESLDVVWGETDTNHGQAYVDAFVDLDGDGVTDRIQTMPYYYCTTPDCGTMAVGYRRRAWLNKFSPPIIKGFPSGLANNSSVTYTTITSADAAAKGIYSDTAPLVTSDGNTKYAISPLRVCPSAEAQGGSGRFRLDFRSYS
jgi:hypothetical protein